MKKIKLTAEEEVMRFFQDDWATKHFKNFLDHCVQLIKIYGGEEEDWENVMKNRDETRGAMIFSAYFMSRIAELHAGHLVRLKVEYPKLWKKIQDEFDLEKIQDDL